MTTTKGELLQKKKKNQEKRKHIWIAMGCICFVILGTLFFRIPYFRISHVEVTGLETLDVTAVAQSVTDSIAGDYLFILPRKNVFLIQKSKLTYRLKALYPRIDTVKVRKHFHVLDITITERRQNAIWCTDGLDCYFVHDDGTIFDTTGIFSNPLYFVYDTPVDSSVTGSPIGLLVLPAEKFARVEAITQVMADYGVKIYGYKTASSYEDYFYITPLVRGAASAYIKARPDQSAETIASNLVTALKTDALKREKDNHFLSTDYIDLRFDGKVVYKLTQVEEEK